MNCSLLKLLKFVLLLLALYSTVILHVGTFSSEPETEYGFYVNYAQSIVENHDLNILDQIKPAAAWIVSETFNYPEMHDYGISIFWSPLFYFAHLVQAKPLIIGHKNSTISAEYIVVLVSNFVLTFLSFSLLSSWYRKFSGMSVHRVVLFAVFWGTGFFYYLFEQYDGTETTVFFFAMLMVYYASLLSDRFTFLDFVFLGIFFAFGRLIKIHFISFILPFMFFYISSLKRNGIKKHAVALLSFSVGAIPILFANEYNNFLKFGFVNFGQGYLEEFSFESFLNNQNILDSYFGPVGLFSQMPIFLLACLSFLYLLYKWIENPNTMSTVNKLAVVVYVSIIAKMALFLFVPTCSQIEFGGRNFIIDTVAQILVLNAIYERFKSNLRNLAICKFLMVGSVFWTILNYFWYSKIVTLIPDQRLVRYMDDPAIVWNQALNLAINLKTTFAFFPSLFFSNVAYLLWFIFPTLVLYNYKKIIRWLSDEKKIKFVSIYLFLLVTVVTFLNHKNNRMNANVLRNSGRFDNIVIGNGPHIFTYDNVATDLVPSLEADKHRRHKKKFDAKLEFFQKFLVAAKNEVVFDNIGFLNQLEQGKLPKIGITDDDSASEVLNYYGPDRIQH